MQSGAHRESAFPRPREASRRCAGPAASSGRSGQSLIETCLALFLICLLFAGFFQVSQILAAREVLQHAAARAARAKTVGFNQWMVKKCVRAALIPNAGRMLEPAYTNENQELRNMTDQLAPGPLWDRLLALTPSSAQYDLERARIPQYLGSENASLAKATLDYERWQDDSIDYTKSVVAIGTNQTVVDGGIQMTVEQKLPLTVPLHRGFYADDSVKLAGEKTIESHFPLYIEDQNL